MSFPSGIGEESREKAQSGIKLLLYPSTAGRFTINIQRSSSGSTYRSVARLAAIGQPSYVFSDLLPVDGGYRTYRARHELPGYDNGPWTASVTAAPLPFGDDLPLLADTRRRVDSMRSQDGVLLAAVGQVEGGEIVPLMTGYLSGAVNGGSVSTAGWQDGPAVSFAKSFGSPPVVRCFTEQNSVTYEPDPTAWTSSAAFVSTGRQAVECRAVNVTA